MEQPSPNPLKVVATVAVWLLAIANLYYLRVADPDLWWYLRCGEDILTSGQIRQVDAYSFTAAGRPHLNHEWLTEVLFAFAFQQVGPAGLVGLKLAAGIGFLIVFHRLLRLHSDDARVYLPMLLLAAHAVGRFALLRPQTFTFLFFAATLWVLELDRRQRTNALWYLPPLLCLWANMHAACAVGVALIGYYFVMAAAARDVSAKRLGVVLTLSALATLLNPFGWDLWRCAVQGLFDPLNKTYVEEWRPVLGGPLTWNSVMFFTMVAFSGGALALARSRRWGDAILWLIFVALGMSAPRHIPLFAIVAVPLATRWLADWTSRQAESRRLRLALASVAGVVLVPALLTAYFALLDPRPRVRIRDMHYRGFPFEAVELLRQQPQGGNVWTELEWGGYLLWKAGPKWKVSIDGRNTTVYPRNVVEDHFRLASSELPANDVLSRYPIDVCLLHRDRKFAEALANNERWQKVYEDSIAVMFWNHTSANMQFGGAHRFSMRPKELFLEQGE